VLLEFVVSTANEFGLGIDYEAGRSGGALIDREDHAAPAYEVSTGPYRAMNQS
jgi:hypothetical protein